MIAIVDFNMGNLGSIRNMLKKAGVEARVTSSQEEIAAATALILPGVGAFDAGMESLHASGLIPVLNERVLQARVPTLGICLGMQLMTRRSEEGRLAGLGWIEALARRFQPTSAAPKIPHMGWNAVRAVRPSPLVDDLPPDPRFYFVHSYYVQCEQPEDVLLKTSYGIDFDSAFQRGNVAGVQFHPEKSHRFGMQLLRNFAQGFRSC